MALLTSITAIAAWSNNPLFASKMAAFSSLSQADYQEQFPWRKSPLEVVGIWPFITTQQSGLLESKWAALVMAVNGSAPKHRALYRPWGGQQMGVLPHHFQTRRCCSDTLSATGFLLEPITKETGMGLCGQVHLKLVSWTTCWRADEQSFKVVWLFPDGWLKCLTNKISQ